ncbi:MAG TPA: hypothetical protein VJ748_04055 [Vitreimonas sp.]|jgi:hypothetical protein|nr:hypothetical protein [Vitreimonas sp.]
MSLNKTLDRLFDEIRREAKRNPEFADRLDAVLRLHDSRRDVADEVVEELASSPAGGGPEQRDGEGRAAPPKSKRRNAPLSLPGSRPDSSPASAGVLETPALNPAGLYKREGEDALTAALAALDHQALRALIAEHNLDPSGATATMDDAELATHIIAQAKRRAERDEKMFDY